MKIWFEGVLESGDQDIQCSKCRVWVKAPKPHEPKGVGIGGHFFQEFQLQSGGMPHPDELHSNPTGNYMCPNCAKMTLI